MDNEEIVREQLRRLGGRQKTAGDWHMVQCAFHDDSSPSCGVYLRKDDPNRKFGSFNCLGCGAHGDWNVFAEKASLEQIKAWNSAETLQHLQDTLSHIYHLTITHQGGNGYEIPHFH